MVLERSRRYGLPIVLSAVLVAFVAAAATSLRIDHGGHGTAVFLEGVRRLAITQWPLRLWRQDTAPRWIDRIQTDAYMHSNDSTSLDTYTVCSPGHGSIYTGEIDEHGEAVVHACMVIDDGRVARIGTRNESLRWLTAPPFELQHAQSIVPGLHDAHGHVLDLGWARAAADLVGATSVHEAVKRIEAYLRARPDLLNDRSRWIQGIGWDQTKWTPATFPTAEDLEASPLLAGRKVMLRRIDVHALWLSRSALEAIEEAGVMPFRSDPEPEGGLVLRDETTGRPSGCLIDKAMNLAYAVVPPWTDDERKQYLDSAADALLSVGITSVGDAAVDLDSVSFYKQHAARMGTLPFRVYVMLACPPDQPRCAAMASDRLGAPFVARPFTQDRLSVRTVKLFADGALGSWGSAMWEPYSDRPDWRGLMLIDEGEVEPLIRYWTEAGWNVATHCIGDRAQTIALDAYESVARDHAHRQPLRNRIEHAQLVRKRDIARFGSLGVVASMQPTHCTSDMAYVEQRIGAERARDGAYAWQAILDANATLAFGSDFPVEEPNPVHGFYSAVTRLDAQQRAPATADGGGGTAGWYPDNRVSRAQALHAFTVAPAFAQFEENIGGALSVGRRADFVLLNDDLLRQHDLAKLRDTRVLATFLDGRVAWKRI